MAYVRQFREYFEKNGMAVSYDRKYLRHNTKYIEHFVSKGTHKDVVEIDINRAYPTAGRLLGIIPEELWKKGEMLSKSAMLVSIGSLARHRKTIKVSAEGERTLVSQEEPEPHLLDIWKTIVAYVDYAMQSVCKGMKGRVLFYYCDAIYCKKDVADKVKKKLTDMGFLIKEIPIKSVVYSSKRIQVTKGDGTVKNYGLPRRFGTENLAEQYRIFYEQQKTRQNNVEH